MNQRSDSSSDPFAANLREHASLPRLGEAARAALLRNAEWADGTALHWGAGADDCRS